MSAPIKHQIIESQGKPLFVLVPYDTYIKSMQRLDIYQEETIPHKVVELTVLQDKSPVRAWREYLGLTQKQVAKRLKVSQSAYSQMERAGAKLRADTVKKIARALKIKSEQLDI